MLRGGGRLASNTVAVMGCGSSLEISGQKIDIKGNAKKPIDDKKPAEETKKPEEPSKRISNANDVQNLTRNRSSSSQNSGLAVLGRTPSQENGVNIVEIPQVSQAPPKALPKSTSFTLPVDSEKTKKSKGKKTKVKKDTEAIAEEKLVLDKKQEINAFFLEHWSDVDTNDNYNRLHTRFGTSQLLGALSYSEYSKERIKHIICTFASVSKGINQLVRKGGAQVLVPMLRTYSDDLSILTHLLFILDQLSKKDKRFSIIFRLEGGFKIFLSLLKLYPEWEVTSTLLNILKSLTTKNDNNSIVMVKENGAQVLVQLIEQQKGDPEKLSLCLQLLKNICRVDVNAKTILTSIPNICELVLQITQQNSLNKVVLKPAVSILKQLLSVDENLRTMLQAKGNMLTDLLSIYSGQPDIVQGICLLVWKITASRSYPIPTNGFIATLPQRTAPISEESISFAPDLESRTVQLLESATETLLKGINQMVSYADRGEDESVGEEVYQLNELVEKELALEKEQNEGDDDDDEDVENQLSDEEIFSDIVQRPTTSYHNVRLSRDEASLWFIEKMPKDEQESYKVDVDHSVRALAKPGRPPVKHIRYVPSAPEPCHTDDIEALTVDMMMHDLNRLSLDNMRIVYDSLEPVHDRKSDDLIFDANFECGNCRRVLRISENEYDIITNTDVNIGKHTQWYYFAVSNMKDYIEYKFNIINLEKPSSEYNFGMKPLMYSEKEARETLTGWVRCGSKICYYGNHLNSKSSSKPQSYYTLTFTILFQHSYDKCYFAPCYPYSVSQLKEELHSLESDRGMRDRFRRTQLTTTLAGNVCDLLTITSFPCTEADLKNRKYVFFTSRVHPGESQSSWMMKGIIDYLVSNEPTAATLRENFVFKIVPMLNMDGVIEGNHRCSYAAVDLNRQYLFPEPQLHPTIYALKKMITHVTAFSEVQLYVDLHGHFRKKNIFMYGCNNDYFPDRRLKECIFPYLLSQKDPNFSFKDCSFTVSRSKRACGRVVVGKDLQILNSYTMEASFCGMDIGPNKNCHLDIGMLEQIGVHLCETLALFIEPHQTQVKEALEQILKMNEQDVEPQENLQTGKKKTKKKAKKKANS